MQLLETLSLGGRRQLFLVACDGRNFLIGTGSDHVGSIVPIALDADASTMDFPVKRPLAMGSNR
jgi:hypothetical protein